MLRVRTIPTLVPCALALLCSVSVATAEPTPNPPQGAASAEAQAVSWQSDYAVACQQAESQRKMLLLFFHDPQRPEETQGFESRALSDPNNVARLADWICVRLPVDAAITSGGQPLVLLKHPAFAEMVGRPGLAVIDYAHRDTPYYGLVVGTFPFLEGRTYTPWETAVILDLPPGTLTQRMLIFAVRTHPDHPASTTGRFDSFLANQAESHSLFQAILRHQGHHNWDSRFQFINARLPFGLLASEVCAESWPGQCLLEAAIDCVKCWRTSSGHWSKVVSPQQVYGYDMKRGANGIWYATGIFGRR